MRTLQKTFRYEGDLTKTSAKEVNIKFNIPVYEYSKKGEIGEFVWVRKTVSHEPVSITNKLNATDYQVSLPEYFIIGKDSSTIEDCLKYYEQSSKNGKLDDISAKIEVQYFIENKPIGDKSFEVICYPVSYIPENFIKSVIFINGESYRDLLNKLSFPRSREFYFLEHILSPSLVDITAGNYPVLLEENKINIENIIGYLNEFHVNNSPDAINTIKNYIKEKLFDFPLFIPTGIDVGGTFTVKTSDNPDIKKEDLFYYDLSLEYSTSNGDLIEQSQVVHFDWNKISNIQNNTVPFSFTNNNPISQEDLVSVNVTGFDGSVLYSQKFEPQDSTLSHIKIEVPLIRPIKLKSLDKKDLIDKNKKLRGQVITLSKKCPLKDLTVLIQAKNDGDKIWRIVGAANTDNSGNFSIPYPYGIFTEAQAIVSLMPNKPVAISILADNKNSQTISDDFLYLLLKDIDCALLIEEEDGDCHSSKKTSRLPDHADLIGSDEYSQDIGGSCVNLSMPNRTLNEYNYKAVVRTSDPDVANYTLEKIGNSYQLTGGVKIIERLPVDLDNPIRWQNTDTPNDEKNLSIYQAVSVATGHILHYKALFKADGYSLGNLIYSLALAPGQKKEIVVFDSSHILQAAESQNISQGERLAAGLINDREITNQLGGSINEAMRGSSSANTSGVSAGFGIGAIASAIGGVLGVSGGTANSSSSASQDSSRSVSQFFGEKLRQSIMQNAEGYRQLNASVVTSVSEGQRYAVTSEVVANHNHCHALTMMYFEVLRHYAIFQELSSVEECVFVPLLMTNFSTENIYKWRDVLAKNLLSMPSNTYLQSISGGQHPLLKAFDANERIKTNYENVDFPDNRFCDEVITSIQGYITLRVNIPRPNTFYDRIMSFPVVKREIVTNTRGGLWGGL